MRKTNTAAAPALSFESIRERLAEVERLAKAAGEERGRLVRALGENEERLCHLRAQLVVQEDPSQWESMAQTPGEAHCNSRILRLDGSGLAGLKREIARLEQAVVELRSQAPCAATELEAREAALAILKREVLPSVEQHLEGCEAQLQRLRGEQVRITAELDRECDPDRLLEARRQGDELPLRLVCAEIGVIETRLLQLRLVGYRHALHLSYSPVALQDRLAELYAQKRTLTTGKPMRLAAAA